LRNLKLSGYATNGKSSGGVVKMGYDSYTAPGQVAFEKIRLQNVDISGNANRALRMEGIKHLSIETSKFNDNGLNGTSGGRMHEAQYIDSTWDGNNWRSDGFGASYGWASANFKFFLARDQTFLRCNFLNGQHRPVVRWPRAKHRH